ncbi:uncharacterized protein LOC130714276 [Lotus japonicus]|uniref:uncharacterized protein LOC130714276 n=1 Tax=Lotus japonicus TaxID=34305 RepID=UPI002587A94C|nr:uncharacterized protein LOC130714276 [Lotus japonicus]
MAVNLTPNAIPAIVSGDLNSKPLLQVLDIKLISNSKQQERDCILLSDAVSSQQAMLATQLNDQLRAGLVKRGSVVQLIEYICSPIQNRKIIVALNMETELSSIAILCDMESSAKRSEEPFRLLIVDSVIALFRVDFSGRGELAERQQNLFPKVYPLVKICVKFNVAVYMTNQVIVERNLLYAVTAGRSVLGRRSHGHHKRRLQQYPGRKHNAAKLQRKLQIQVDVKLLRTTKRALLMAMARDKTAELESYMNTLVECYGFDLRNIVILLPNEKGYTQPQKEIVRSEVKSLIQESNEGDILLLHISAHVTLKYPGMVGIPLLQTGDRQFIHADFWDKMVQCVHHRRAKLTVTLETCHAGALFNSARQQNDEHGQVVVFAGGSKRDEIWDGTFIPDLLQQMRDYKGVSNIEMFKRFRAEFLKHARTWPKWDTRGIPTHFFDGPELICPPPTEVTEFLNE